MCRPWACGIVWSCCTRWRNPGLIRLLYLIVPFHHDIFVAYTFPIISHFPGLNGIPLRKSPHYPPQHSPHRSRRVSMQGCHEARQKIGSAPVAALWRTWSRSEFIDLGEKNINIHQLAISSIHFHSPYLGNLKWYGYIWLWINTYTICRGMNMDLPPILTLENNRLWFWPIPIYQSWLNGRNTWFSPWKMVVNQRFYDIFQLWFMIIIQKLGPWPWNIQQLGYKKLFVFGVWPTFLMVPTVVWFWPWQKLFITNDEADLGGPKRKQTRGTWRIYGHMRSWMWVESFG